MKMVVAAGILLIAGMSVAWPARPSPAQDSLDSAALVEALQAVEGCLGVEQAMTRSGKGALFAWFEDKKAALKWYYSDTHMALMKQFFPTRKGERKPLADVPDDSGPIIAIASITLTEKPTKENPLPYNQIAIELYQPLGGGISIGGRFAPEKMKIPPKK